MLGIPRTKAGQIVGWIYNKDVPNGDNYVDFGIFNAYSEQARDFVNGYERTILLDFKVDGNILVSGRLSVSYGSLSFCRNRNYLGNRQCLRLLLHL